MILNLEECLLRECDTTEPIKRGTTEQLTIGMKFVVSSLGSIIASHVLLCCVSYL